MHRILKRLLRRENRIRIFALLAVFNILIFIISLSTLIVAAYAQEKVEGLVPGEKFLGAAIAVAGSTLGAGIALYGTASSGFAALVEKSELSIWLLLIAGLGEGVAI